MKDLVGRDANTFKITGGGNSQQNISDSLFRQGNRMPLLHLCYAIALTLRRGSSALAHTLRYLCATLALLLTFGAGNTFARTFNGTERIYIYNTGEGITDGWRHRDYKAWANFSGTNSANNVEMFLETGEEGSKTAIYYVTPPAGTYSTITLCRGNSVGNPWSDDNVTGAITIDESKNYISSYSAKSSDATWSNYPFVFTEEAVLYFTITTKWWNNSNCWHYAKFKNINGDYTSYLPAYNLSSYITSAALSTASTGKENDVFFVTVGSGTYITCNFQRKSSDSSTGGTWDGNTTNDILLSLEHNKGGTIKEANSSISWTTYQPTSTCALAASSTTITTAQTSTLTPSLTSNALLNKIKSTSYAVTTNPGSAGSVTQAGVFSATAAGTYTVTATITYNAKGFPDLTSTTTATQTITVNAAGVPTHDVTVYYKCGESDIKASSTASSVPESGAGSTVSAPAINGYTFSSWTLGSGVTGSSATNSITINTTSGGSGYTLTANYTQENYTITLSAGIGGSITSSASFANRHYGDEITITASPDAGYRFTGWTPADGSKVLIDNANALSATVTVKGTTTITANFEKELYYVCGTHLHDQDNWSSNRDLMSYYSAGNYWYYLVTYSHDVDDNWSNYYLQFKVTDKEQIVDEQWGKVYNTLAASQGDVGLTKLDGVDANIQATGSNAWSDGRQFYICFNPSSGIWASEINSVPFADINEITLSTTRIPPMASITATPSMTRKGTGDKAYCWKLFSDAACTAEVAASFASVGDGAVSFLAPATRGTYYLRLQVHSDDGCASTLDDEEVVSFEVTTTDMVFFRNVPNWGSVHVYFLGTTSYWDDNNGSGCVGRDYGIAHGMTRIPNTNIYYYDYHGNGNVVFNPSGAAYIAFTDNYLPNADNFSGCQAVYRADFSACAPMYVPENYISEYKNTSAGNGPAAYYNRGYWTNYMSTASGFTLHIYDGKTKNQGNEITSQALTAASIGDNTYSFTYDFASAGKNVPYTYGFEVSGCGGAWYAVDADMNINNCTNWNLFTGTTRRGGVDINANVAHTFVLTLTRDGHIQLSVDYPPAEGDYRLLYDDDTQAPHPSQVIRKRADGKDTVAMYIRPSAAGSTLKVQSVSLSPSITWSDYATIEISGLRDSVYLFYLEQDGSGALSVNTSETKPYVGPYYIRTQSVDGGWDSYRNSPDNLMTYSQWSADQGYGFNYYKTKWVSPAGSYVTFTVACDYSEALCDTMMADLGDNPLNAAQAQNLPQPANVRFGWSSHTNRLTRAYISGSSNVSDRFLVLRGDSKMKDKDGNELISGAAKVAGLNDYEMNFADLGNWIYRADIKAVPGAQVRLTADYNGRTQYFIGTVETPETIIGGSTGEPQPMRVTYDFKTNRLTTAWLPNGERIEDDITLKADMMLIRKGQEAATQITFASGKQIEEIKSIYGVMEFKKSEIAGQFPNWSAPNAYAYLMYYVSFPFDVRVRDIFGAGVMGENWIIQKYNGAKRAEIGWFAETSTFWETLPADSILHKHEGYLLLLDRISFNDESSDLWDKIPSDGSIYLYFPSASHSIGTISDKDQPITVPSHVCSINRTFTVDGVPGTLSHKNTDSHWNVIGTPLFATANASTVGPPVADGNGETALQYYYAWNSSNNTLYAQATFDTEVTFKSMHGYMVQYAGVVTFHGAAITPASVAARRRVQVEPNYRVELQLVSEENKTSHTYVELRENACDTFALNEDMYMMRSSKTVDLYSFAGAYDVAANVLSLSDHTVPLGLDVKRAGTYRFTMPSSFSGTVTLLDKTTGTRTNLALGDYEVWLDRGMVNNRFELVLSVSQMTTAIDAVGDPANGQGCKYLQDGQLYILKEGVVYDARGTRVK